MNGFHAELRRTFVETMPMITVTTSEPAGFSDLEATLDGRSRPIRRGHRRGAVRAAGGHRQPAARRWGRRATGARSSGASTPQRIDEVQPFSRQLVPRAGGARRARARRHAAHPAGHRAGHAALHRRRRHPDRDRAAGRGEPGQDRGARAGASWWRVSSTRGCTSSTAASPTSTSSRLAISSVTRRAERAMIGARVDDMMRAAARGRSRSSRRSARRTAPPTGWP